MNKRPSENKDLDVSYDYETSIIKVTYLGNELYRKDFTDFAKGLINKYGIQNGENTIPNNEMTLIDENDKVKVKIVFQNISGSRSSFDDRLDSKGFDFYVLVKVK